MQKRRLIRFLADHAEAMNRIENGGELDAAMWLAAHSPGENGAATLLLLLQLAQAVKRALVPVEPSLLFQSDLKAQLSLREEVAAVTRPFPHHVWLGQLDCCSSSPVYCLTALARRQRPFDRLLAPSQQLEQSNLAQ